MFIIFVALILRNVEDFSQTERLVAKKQNNKKKNTKKSKKQKKKTVWKNNWSGGLVILPVQRNEKGLVKTF